MRPTEMLQGEHRVIEQVLNCLEIIADRAAFGGVLDRESARKALDFFRDFADGCHHAKEEKIFFPALEAQGLPHRGGPTGVMRAEHELGRQHMKAMGVGLDVGDARAFARHAWAFVRLMREHMTKEDQRLFPVADRMLTDADQELVRAAFAHAEAHDPAHRAHEEYVRLADELADRFGVRKAHEPADQPGCGCHLAP